MVRIEFWMGGGGRGVRGRGCVCINPLRAIEDVLKRTRHQRSSNAGSQLPQFMLTCAIRSINPDDVIGFGKGLAPRLGPGPISGTARLAQAGNHLKSSATGSGLTTTISNSSSLGWRGRRRQKTCLRCSGRQCRSQRGAARVRWCSTWELWATRTTCTQSGTLGRLVTTATLAAQAPTSRQGLLCAPLPTAPSSLRRPSFLPTRSSPLLRTASARVQRRRSALKPSS